MQSILNDVFSFSETIKQKGQSPPNEILLEFLQETHTHLVKHNNKHKHLQKNLLLLKIVLLLLLAGTNCFIFFFIGVLLLINTIYFETTYNHIYEIKSNDGDNIVNKIARQVIKKLL